MQKYIDKKKAILLLAVLAVYVIIITPLLIINLQKKQELRGRALITTPTPTPTIPTASVDNSSSYSGAASVSATIWDHIIGSNPNTLLLVGVSNMFPQNPISSVVCQQSSGNIPLTWLKSIGSQYGYNNWDVINVYYLKNPPAGKCHIVVSHTLQSDFWTGGAISLYNVNLDNPFGSIAVASPSGGINPVSVTVPHTDASQLIIGVAASFMATPSAALDNMTSRWFTSGFLGSSFTSNNGVSMPGTEPSSTLSWKITDPFWSRAVSLIGIAINSAITPTPSLEPTSILTSTPIPTSPTLTPATTSFSLTVYEHGIGNSGDNTNPIDNSLSNKNPVHQTINANVQIFDMSNQLVASGEGKLTYASDSGKFQGIATIPSIISPGQYYLKVKTDFHLQRLVSDIITITAGAQTNIPAVTLVAGDANNDNKLDILDYNMLLGCYSDLAAAVSCTPDQKVATDFNDDGSVNQFDYNLFIRELATQPGQ